MMNNYIKTGKRSFERITVGNDNRVKITTVRGKNPEENETVIKRYERKFQIIVPMTIGNITLVQGLGKTTIEVFNINRCLRICQVERGSKIEYLFVGGEIFIKVTDENLQVIYDEVGNIIDKEVEKDLTVIFSGSGPCLQKISRETGRKELYSFEGKLVG